ncbi:MAG: glycolate oxidase subunit GlcF [Rhodobacteraceae bacterium]|nr:glycolate oxidase subunit GlcF [Paracoccaceae bacterium]
MQTTFTDAQLKDSDLAVSNQILRTCVHCGFCTATCPTYQILGDELDSPRGRIYLIKQMLEEGRPADAQTVKHIDRCLSCLSCMTTCPSGVHYMHLVDHARAHIEQTYRRPLGERALRELLAYLLPKPGLFRLSLFGARIVKPLRSLIPGKLGAMIDFAPSKLPKASTIDAPQVIPAVGERRMRVAMLTGCAQRVLAPQINEATVRLLTRHGAEVVIAQGVGCCGALTHHMGKTAASHISAAANINAWMREVDGEGLDAVVINASGCGTTVKDYAHMFRDHADLAGAAARISALARDVSEVMVDLGVSPATDAPGLRVAYHAACSLQHGQQIKSAPKQLLKAAGYAVVEPAESHLCCGSAGTYNLLQPELAEKLKKRKVKHLEAKQPEVVATGNIGCMTQIAAGTEVPVVHTVELLDWATGGPKPGALS